MKFWICFSTFRCGRDQGIKIGLDNIVCLAEKNDLESFIKEYEDFKGEINVCFSGDKEGYAATK